MKKGLLTFVSPYSTKPVSVEHEDNSFNVKPINYEKSRWFTVPSCIITKN